MRIAQVWMEYAVQALDQTFSYLCDEKVQRGMRVNVPLGNNNKIVCGFVESVVIDDRTKEEFIQKEGYELKSIISIVDEQPLLNEELMQLGRWMAKQTISTVISCYQAMVPAKMKPKSNRERIAMDFYVRYLFTPENLTIRQKEILSLCINQDVLRTVLMKKSSAITKKLIEMGAVEVYQKPRQIQAVTSLSFGEKQTLTTLQQQAFDTLCSYQEGVCLLHGATGSGKTEVYLQLAEEYVKKGKQVLILVPEISLTPQMIHRVKQRFLSTVAVYHSGLNSQEKYEQYQLVKHHEVSIVVGTRSAVFMPFDQLGLVVVDEEHDSSYKQDSSPRYHCRDVAIQRAKYHHALVVLGSATPSLESYARTLKGVYHLVSMPQRISGMLPHVQMVEMRQEIQRGDDILSAPLVAAMQDRLSKHEQIILLLNRRGYAPVKQCKVCGTRIQCPNCDVPMSYHKEENMLLCHICGKQTSVMQPCPSCGSSRWTYSGIGTQRLEDKVKQIFPQAKVLRMDADSTVAKGAHTRMLEQFGNHEADVLLGTQMIAKGLDYPDVTLVGIISADAPLNHPDYRSSELTFDLLVQASGRSGRAKKDGLVLMQVFDPSHYALRFAAKQDYDSFFRAEMSYRHIASYPPYTYFISIVASCCDQQLCQKTMEQVKKHFQTFSDISVLGVSELLRKRNLYRYRILLRGKDVERMRSITYAWYQNNRQNKQRVTFEIDVNPQSLEG